ESSVALSVLKQGNQPIVTIALSKEPVMGESDLVCLPDVTIEEVDLDRLDSLLLPGCMDIGVVKDEERLFELIRQVHQRNLPIAAISSAPYLLAKAGVLQGRKYTVAFVREQRDFLGVFDEEHYSSDWVVTDGNLITARGRAFVEFGIRFGEVLGLEFDPRWYKV
ncbi:MAG: DJ-1/PfpI family protein, partial [Tumebacillaceae bacterium]